jgi:hypothetical protein
MKKHKIDRSCLQYKVLEVVMQYKVNGVLLATVMSLLPGSPKRDTVFVTLSRLCAAGVLEYKKDKKTGQRRWFLLEEHRKVSAGRIYTKFLNYMEWIRSKHAQDRQEREAKAAPPPAGDVPKGNVFHVLVTVRVIQG